MRFAFSDGDSPPEPGSAGLALMLRKSIIFSIFALVNGFLGIILALSRSLYKQKKEQAETCCTTRIDTVIIIIVGFCQSLRKT